jgi:flagellin
MALESVDFSKNAVLVQSATSMLAQANVKTQTVLQLLNL